MQTQEQKPKVQRKKTLLTVSSETRERVHLDVERLNQKDWGRKVVPDDIVTYAINLLTPAHFQTIQEGTLTNADKLERNYKEYVRANGTISKDEYLGKILSGEMSRKDRA